VRLRCNALGMRTHLPPAEASGGLWVAQEGPRLAGVLVGAAPGAHPFAPPPWRARLRCAFGQGLAVARRWAVVAESLQIHHPLDEHWYLATLGVEPARQGRGVGRALLGAWLAQVDEDGGRAYLETDAPRNVSFYERAGFGTRAEIRVLGVPVWLMERPAGVPRRGPEPRADP
jgi:ribosomal protein S18 acetylase RimI-like enzyme